MKRAPKNDLEMGIALLDPTPQTLQSMVSNALQAAPDEAWPPK